MNELKGGANSYEGSLVLDIHKSLCRGSGPSKSHRNALSLFDLKVFKYFKLYYGKLVK